MKFPQKFICATQEKNSYQKSICSPYFRKKFTLSGREKTQLIICGLGFYRVFLNGKEITKGRLAPYISNPNEAIYYDVYQVKSFVN